VFRSQRPTKNKVLDDLGLIRTAIKAAGEARLVEARTRITEARAPTNARQRATTGTALALASALPG
jgi:hypothetical protein